MLSPPQQPRTTLLLCVCVPLCAPACVACVCVACLQAASAGGAWWSDYFKLLDESRFVHVTSLDFATLTALMPFWMDNDATARNWDKR